MTICSGDWYESYRLLYGPYPTPPNDFEQEMTDEEISSITGVYAHPPNVDPNVAAYHMMGVIFGTAVGDCLGIYCEGLQRDLINIFIDQPIDITWTHPVTTERGAYFHRGSFTDDTALMLMFIRSVVSTALKNTKKSTVLTMMKLMMLVAFSIKLTAEKEFNTGFGMELMNIWMNPDMDVANIQKKLSGHMAIMKIQSKCLNSAG